MQPRTDIKLWGFGAQFYSSDIEPRRSVVQICAVDIENPGSVVEFERVHIARNGSDIEGCGGRIEFFGWPNDSAGPRIDPDAEAFEADGLVIECRAGNIQRGGSVFDPNRGDIALDGVRLGAGSIEGEALDVFGALGFAELGLFAFI